MFGLHMFGMSDLMKYMLKEDWGRAKTECEEHPREAKVWSTRVGFFDGEHESHVLPLHQACALRAPNDLIEALILAYPQAVQSRESSFRRLPLHISCQSGGSADVVRTLLAYYPEGGTTLDCLGRLPLHYACSNGASPDVVEELLRMNPRAASFRDIHHWLPIHVACHFGASAEVVRKLVEANPESIDAKTEKGSTPAKLVKKINCRNKEEIVTLLEEEAPGWKNWEPPMSNIPGAHNDDEHNYSGLVHRHQVPNAA